MAVFQRADGTREVVVGSTVLGRARNARIRLRDDRVSSQHALVDWDGTAWTVTDLGSRNGTWVGDDRLATLTARRLSAGDRLALGGPDGVALTVTDAGPPVPWAIGPDGDLLRGEPGLLAPVPEAWSVYAAHNAWVLEQRDGTTGPAPTEVAGYRLILPDLVATRVVSRAVSLDDVRLVCWRSTDEEHVRIEVHHPDADPVVFEQTPWLVVYALAAQQVADVDLPESDRGWCDTQVLASELGVSPNHLSVLVSRVRRDARRKARIDEGGRLVRGRRHGLRLSVPADRITLG